MFPCANNGVVSWACGAGHLLVCQCCLRGASPASGAGNRTLPLLSAPWGDGGLQSPSACGGGVSTVCPLWWWCDFCCDLWSVPSGWLAVSPGAGPSIRRLGRRSSERGWEEGCYSPSAHRAVDHQCLPAEKTCFVLLLLACCRDKQITRNAYHTVEKCTRQEQ